MTLLGTQIGSFCVSVRCNTLARALAYVGAEAGYTQRMTTGPTTFVVTDRVTALDAGQLVGWRRVLVADPTPRSCRLALNALSAGSVIAVLLSDQPDELGSILDSIAEGRAVVPTRVVELAAHMPQLTDRQVAVLSAVIAGQTNREIGRGLHLSEASVKRELAELYRTLSSTTRLALANDARALGFQPHRVEIDLRSLPANVPLGTRSF